MSAKPDEVSITPTLLGPHGKAWAVDLDAARKLQNVKPEDDGTIAIWLVEAPWAHGFWHSYGIMLVHLREMPDKRETKFYLPDATHELWVYALDPDKPREEMIRSGSMQFLTPKNFAAQIIEQSDDTAKLRIATTVLDIIAGRLSPDTDFHSEWVRRFGDNMVKLAYREFGGTA